MPKFQKKIYDFMTIVSDDSVGEIWVYGDITDEAWYDTDVTPQRIRDALNEMGPVGTINLRVNSYGGSVIAGNAIVNLLDSYKRKTGAKIHAYIEGIAASMGSGIPMVADYIYMAENAMFMIHKPFSFAIGNADDMEREKVVLEKVEDTLVVNYMRHFNGTEDELRQMIADETWLTADEALQYGFCDEIIPAVAIAASANAININGTEFKKAADVMKNKFKEYKKEGKEMFKYDASLAKYGMSEESFNALGISADVANQVASGAVSAYQVYLDGANWMYDNGTWQTVCTSDNSDWETQTLSNFQIVQQYMTEEQVKDALGEEMDAESVLNLAKVGKQFDADADRKAKAYDKMVTDAIDKAIASGIKAKGDGFKEDKWRKILASLDYDEIVDQMHEWDAEAKIAVNAGKRIAEPWQNDSHEKSVNPNDYI